MGRKSKLDTTITPCFKETVSDGMKIIIELDERVGDDKTDCIVRKYMISRITDTSDRQLLQIGEGRDWSEAFANLHHVLA